MAQVISSSRGQTLVRWLIWAVTFSIAALAWAQDLTFSAKADKTTADLGEPITLTLTLTGDITGVELPQMQLPEGWAVAAQSQSTNFSIRAGATERSMNVVYVLIPQQAGTFQLGPFKVTRRKQEFQTEPIDVTVRKPALPPSQRQPHGERFTL